MEHGNASCCRPECDDCLRQRRLGSSHVVLDILKERCAPLEPKAADQIQTISVSAARSYAQFMALAALIVAIVGAVTGIVALAWQVISFRRSGWRLRVELLAPDPPRGEPQRPGQLYRVVRITNTGRQAALVSEVMLVAQPEKSHRGDSLCHVILHDQHSESLRVEASQETSVKAWIDESDLPSGNIRIYGVAYAGGRIYESKSAHLLVASDWRVRHLRP